MKITIIGAGAMGSLFGSFLCRAGQAVLLVDIWQEHVDTINDQGLGVEIDGKTEWIKVKASHTISDKNRSDLVIIFVKSIQTENAAAVAVDCLNDNGLVLTLQNGMGNADIISGSVDPDQVIAGTTSHGATMLGPGLIRHAGVGPTLIGTWADKSKTDITPVRDALISAGFDTQVAPDIRLIIWKKLMINVGINAVTALTGIKNGSIVDTPPTGELVRAAVSEANKVASANGIELPDDIVEQVFAVAKGTAFNRSSMGQDVDNQRQTEIDAINGAIVRMAKDKAILVPVNHTLTALVKILQHNYE